MIQKRDAHSRRRARRSWWTAALLATVAVGLGSLATDWIRREQGVVVVDESLDELFSIRDHGFMGYSQGADLLRRRGYTVVANTQPLPAVLSTLQPARRHLLVLGLRFGRTIGAENIAALRAFLARGGRVLLLVEHDDIYGTATAANEWTRSYGIEVRAAHTVAVRDPARSPGPLTLARAPQLGVDSARFYFAVPLHAVATPVETLAVDPAREPIVLSTRAGIGRLTVVGESEFLWNGTAEFGLRAAENTQLWLELVRNLLAGDQPWRPRRAEPALSISHARRPPVTSGSLAVLGDSSDARLSSGPNGYGAFFDLLRRAGYRVDVTRDSASLAAARAVVVVSASEPLPAAVLHARRVIAFVNTRSTSPAGYDRPIAGPTAMMTLDVTTDDPMTGLLASRGITPLAAVLREPTGTFAVADDGAGLESASCRWSRAAALRVDGPRLVVLRRADARAGADGDLLWLATAPGRIPVARLAPGPADGWPLIVEATAILALATGAPLENQSAEGRCFQEISRVVLDWLAASSVSSPGQLSRVEAFVGR